MPTRPTTTSLERDAKGNGHHDEESRSHEGAGVWRGNKSLHDSQDDAGENEAGEETGEQGEGGVAHTARTAPHARRG